MSLRSANILAYLFSGISLGSCVQYTSLDSVPQPNINCAVAARLATFPLDPLKFAGTWYEYMSAGSSIPRDFANKVNIYTPLLPAGGGPSAVRMNWTTTLYLLRDGSRKCSGIFSVSSFTTTGKKDSSSWIPETTDQQAVYFNVLYTDYTTVEIAFRCVKLNTTTGVCEDSKEPILLVNSRQSPPTLSSETKHFIDEKVDSVLKQYCLTKYDLAFATWDARLPDCYPAAPPEFTQTLLSGSKP